MISKGVNAILPQFSSSDITVIREFKAEPTDRRKRQALNTLYWDTFFRVIRERSSGGSAQNLRLNELAPFFDWGLMDPALLENGEADIVTVKKEGVVNDQLPVWVFSDWVEREYQRVLSFDKRDALKAELDEIEHTLKNKANDQDNKREERRNLFTQYLETALASKGMNSVSVKIGILNRFEKIHGIEDLKLLIFRQQKQVSTGKFLDVTGKRELATQQQELQKQVMAYKTVLTELRNPAAEKEIMALSEELNVLMMEQVDFENRRAKKQLELENIATQAAALSPIEIESKLNESLDYFKGLMILVARRMRNEPFSVWAGKNLPVTRAKLSTVIRLVEEFDPKVFRNERVQFLGLPKFIIIPGYGNSLYDWKNNAILVPTSPPGKIEDSLFAGVVEYKMDMDDDKTLLTSYNKLEENKTIRSHLRLKEKFAKEYAIFMGMETKGYKVLPKDTRIWFNREIAPSRTDIKIPSEFDPVSMPQEAFNQLRKSLDECAEQGKATAWQLYGLGILANYDEQGEKAVKYFKSSFEADPAFLDALYNLSMMYLKMNNRRDAADSFMVYMKKSPQNWWTGVCQEHLMKLR